VAQRAALPAAGRQEDGCGQDEGHEGGGGGAGQPKHKLHVGQQHRQGARCSCVCGGAAGRATDGLPGSLVPPVPPGRQQARPHGRLHSFPRHSASSGQLPAGPGGGGPWKQAMGEHAAAPPPPPTHPPRMAAVSACSWPRDSCTAAPPAPAASACFRAAEYAGLHSASHGAQVVCSGTTVRGMVPSRLSPNPNLSARSAARRRPRAPTPPKLRSTSPAVLRGASGASGWGAPHAG
jgi:hypothetical protein